MNRYVKLSAVLLAGMLVSGVAMADDKSRSGGRYNEAMDFVLSRLGNVNMVAGNVSFFWQYNEVSLSQSKWTWNEKNGMTNSSINESMSGNYQYELEPKRLYAEVVLDGKAVSFSCSTPKCIKVKDVTTNVQNYQNEFKWHFSNEEDAKRTVKALRVMLKEVGARESAY